jgi:hypothetical protein
MCIALSASTMNMNAYRKPTPTTAKVTRLPTRAAATEVTDPERLLAALAAAERPEPAAPRRLVHRGAVKTDLLEAPAEHATIALRENETAIRTASGAVIVRRRPATRAA